MNKKNDFSKFTDEEKIDLKGISKDLEKDYKIYLEFTSDKQGITLKCFLELFRKMNDSKRAIGQTEERAKTAENLQSKLQTELENCKKRIESQKNDFTSKSVAFKEQLVTKDKELKNLQGRFDDLEKRLTRELNDYQPLNNKALESNFKSSFVVNFKEPDYRKEDSNRVYSELETLKKQVELLSTNNRSTFGLLRELNDKLHSYFNLRKDFLKHFYKIEKGKESKIKELNNIKIDDLQEQFFTERIPKMFKENLDNFISFCDEFEQLDLKNFSDFYNNKKSPEYDKKNLDMNSVYRARNLASKNDVLELQALVESYHEKIQKHKNEFGELYDNNYNYLKSATEIYMDDDVTNQRNDVEDVNEFLRIHEEALLSFKEKKMKLDADIHKQINEVANQIQTKL